MQDTKAVQLLHYIARGWALVPLHDVASGDCSCGATGCKSAGKHPRLGEWQRPENLVVAAEHLLTWHAGYPAANWGLATGVVSGVWALDYDPAHVTDPEAAGRLLIVLQSSGTWTQRTGSGGLHWVFALPEDFVPNNGTGRLPAGFDVRGARRGEASGGQIVLAPSVSGRGAYGVLLDAPAAAAPLEVLELVRPTAPRERVERRPVTLTAQVTEQIGRYVLSGLDGVLQEMRAAPVGQRNNTAIRTALRCIELANTGLVDYQSVYAAWWAAVDTHPDPAVTFGRQLAQLWQRAERQIGDRPADLSGVGGAPGWMGGVGVLPFAARVAAPPLGQSGSPGGAGHRPDIAGQQVTGVTAFLDPVDTLLAEMLSVEQLKSMPAPQPLINGLLDLDTTAWLIGASGSYKSFVALDLAAHVGRGEAWRGRPVQQGPVVYVVAEGARGMKLRVEAWEREYQKPFKDVVFLPRPIQANGSEWPVLVEACRRLRPALVIIDTQARVTIGLSENDNSDMSIYVERADEIKRATRACVLTVHHLGRSGTNARGASAIDGAQDAELRVEKGGAYSITLHVDKQKDQAEAPPMPIRLRRSDGGIDPETGRDLSSLVLDQDSGVPQLGGGPVVNVGQMRAVLLFQTILREHPYGEGATRAEHRQMFYDLPEIAVEAPEARRKAWRRAWALLVSRGRVMRYGSSQRFRVWAPPDGAVDGVLTMNTNQPDDMPPPEWNLHWITDEREAEKDSSK